MKPQTIPALLAHGVDNFADSVAIADGDIRITYAQLADEVNRVSRAYLALGVKPGDRIAIWVPNRAEYILALLGAQNIGVAVVPLNTRYKGHEARTILERSRATALVTVQGFLGNDYIDLLAGTDDGSTSDGLFGLPHLHTIVDIAESGDERAMRWSDFLSGADTIEQSAVDEAAAAVTTETIADILFTSGTTGVPKGVMSAHRQTLGVAQVWADGANLTSEDRYLIVNPFFHGFGYKAGLITSLTAGTAIYPLATFDPVEVMKLIEKERITVLPGAPTIFIT
ncbi:MAG TPA: AMP-binding protein, partial [Marmoricola sp.]|nr:AMP-binding protein [Marmoricola sp.]